MRDGAIEEKEKNSREHDAMWDFISPMKIDKHTATCMMAF